MFFQGRALWMVSVAIIKDDIIPAERWSLKERKIAFSAAKKALRYIGDETTDIIKDGSITMTIRRVCMNSERKRVVEKYLQPYNY